MQRPRLTSLIVIAATCALWLGCAEPETSTDPPQGDAPQSLEFVATDHPLGLLREPMLVQHPSGALFLSGYGSQSAELSHPQQVPPLYRSDDQGATWAPVDVGSADDGAIGNSDVDLAVGPNGTLYFATMGFSRSTFRGTHIAMGVSHDVGATWQWHLLSDTDLDDRPWVTVTPDTTAHVIWNDGAGVAYARSNDRGKTWSEQERIYPEGGSSHLASGPNGELAVRVSPMAASANTYHPGVDLIVVSLDGGATWEERPLPGEPQWPTRPEEFATHLRWVEPLAWDSVGNLYHLWGEETTLFLARSADAGATWERWAIHTSGGAESEGVQPGDTESGDTGPSATASSKVFFPFMRAAQQGTGELAATWFEGAGDDLRARIARISVPAGLGPTVVSSAPLALSLFAQMPQGDTTVRVRTTGGEYFPVVFLQDGSLGAATTLEDGEVKGFTWWHRRPASD